MKKLFLFHGGKLCLFLLFPFHLLTVQSNGQSSLPKEVNKVFFQTSEFNQPIWLELPPESSITYYQDISQNPDIYETGLPGLTIEIGKGIEDYDKHLLSFLVENSYAKIETKIQTIHNSRYGNSQKVHHFLFYSGDFKKSIQYHKVNDFGQYTMRPFVKLAHRQLVSIDYQNQYEDAPFGMKRTFFAITFSYKLINDLPNFPSITKTLSGRGKIFRDPDDGTWKADGPFENLGIKLSDRGSEEFMMVLRSKYKPFSFEENLRKNEYYYNKHTNNKGKRPLQGEFVFFHAYARNRDSLMFTSRDQWDLPFMQISDLNKQTTKSSPVEEVLREMAVGDSVTIIMRLDNLPQKPKGFENTDTMYYDVVLLEVRTEKEYYRILQEEKEKNEKIVAASQARYEEVASFVKQLLNRYNSESLKEELKETQNHLKYIIHNSGTGRKANIGSLVKVHYFGMLADGTLLNNSFQTGESVVFPLGKGRVIKGWEEGIRLLNEGSRATFFIPYQLGYGEQGKPPEIPGKAELVFYVEVLEIR
ncbi:MAG: FKBP-type peptidyl-prolyl cis-trans isomerase [Lewinellaceae bacterium]|nr:FKBP-type peptidyl-prolyl cis-trans isomerase [Lewinellaceae bacterium]